MKRDFDLIRKLLLSIEGEEVDLSPFKEDQILYHKALLLEAGLVEGPKPMYSSSAMSEIPVKVFIKKLTWSGHDFLDSIRSNDVWNKTKETFVSKGLTMTFDLVKSVAVNLATEFLKGKINC